MQKISLFFYPNKYKTNPTTRMTPIYLRVMIERKKTEKRLDQEYDLSSTELLKWNDASMRIDDRKSETNCYLDRLANTLSDLKRSGKLDEGFFIPHWKSLT